MTTMVTGSGGLIGSRIARKLLARGETVIALDTSEDQPRLDADKGNSRLQRIACDIRDYEQLLASLRELGVERVIHMAAVLAPTTENEPAIGFAVNTKRHHQSLRGSATLRHQACRLRDFDLNVWRSERIRRCRG
jgi:nucleoside-diphosphate-sugar epimerase